MKICLLPGHSPKDGGSAGRFGVYGTLSEYMLAKMVLPAVADELRRAGHEVVITERAAAGGTTPSYSAAAANVTRADLAVELHFNSAGATASGAEWLYFGPSVSSMRVANAMLNKWCSLTGFRNRGPLGCYENEAKAAADGSVHRYTTRGYNAFARSKMKFFMTEPFFASNPTECAKVAVLLKSGDYARFMAQAILAGAAVM